MSNRKSTKRALLMSVISMLICVAMLLGTTFAWFTDNVTSGRNQILAGNLDVELYHNGDDDVKEDTTLFDDVTLWEPGAVAYENFTVKNVGTLALKYQLDLTIFDEQKTPEGDSLSEVIKVGYVKDGVKSTDTRAIVDEVKTWTTIAAIADADVLYPVGNADGYASEKTTGVVLYWEPTAYDDDYNMKNEWQEDPEPFIDFGINLFATQLEYEEDSFDENYDAMADAVKVSTADDFVAALADGGEFVLTDDIELTETATIPAGKKVVLDLGGKTITTPANTIYGIENSGELTIVGDGEVKGGVYAALYSTGKLTVNGGTFTNEASFGVIVDNVYGTTTSVATINGGTFTGVGVYNHSDLTINGGTFNEGNDLDNAEFFGQNNYAFFARPDWNGVEPDCNVTINGGTFNGDIFVHYDANVTINDAVTVTGEVKYLD